MPAGQGARDKSSESSTSIIAQSGRQLICRWLGDGAWACRGQARCGSGGGTALSGSELSELYPPTPASNDSEKEASEGRTKIQNKGPKRKGNIWTSQK